MKCLGLHNEPTAEVHPGHMLTGPKEEEEEDICSVTVYRLIHPVLRLLTPGLFFFSAQRIQHQLLRNFRSNNNNNNNTL
jgi:hypothetical protein